MAKEKDKKGSPAEAEPPRKRSPRASLPASQDAATAGSAKAPAQKPGRRRAADDREQRVRNRAYDIWEQEGRPSGREREHWEQAEREA